MNKAVKIKLPVTTAGISRRSFIKRSAGTALLFGIGTASVFAVVSQSGTYPCMDNNGVRNGSFCSSNACEPSDIGQGKLCGPLPAGKDGCSQVTVGQNQAGNCQNVGNGIPGTYTVWSPA
jgi:hypothetical protein